MAYALVNETGPWCLLTKLREATGIIHYDDGSPLSYPDCSLLSCVWCSSVWVAGALLVLPTVVTMVLAVSTGAILVNRLVKG